MKNPAVIVCSIQTATMVCITLLGYVIYGKAFAVSMLIGSVVAITPQAFFGYWVFRKRGARNAQIIALNFFVGEGLKIGITAILFAVVWINFKDLRTVAVFIGFVIAVLAGQMSLPFLRNGTRI